MLAPQTVHMIEILWRAARASVGLSVRTNAPRYAIGAFNHAKLAAAEPLFTLLSISPSPFAEDEILIYHRVPVPTVPQEVPDEQEDSPPTEAPAYIRL